MENMRHFARAEIALRRLWERSDDHITFLSLEDDSGGAFYWELCFLWSEALLPIAHRAGLCGGGIKANPLTRKYGLLE